MTQRNRGQLDRDLPPREPYLWDKSGPPDPLVQRLEGLLAPLRYQGKPVAVARPLSPFRWRPALAAAAMLVITCGAALWFHGGGTGSPAWTFQTLTGVVKVGERQYTGRGRVHVGQWVHTDATASVRLDVADIGRVTLAPESELRLVTSRKGTEQRIELRRGRLDAFITAPPRLFFVDTPAAVAVDLGCAYELVVDDDGDGEIRVTTGWVMLEHDDRSVLIPAFGMCIMRRDLGPGTPFVEDAPEGFREAIIAFDFQGRGDAAVETILREARDRDWMTLWNLLPVVNLAHRERMVDRLIEVSALPQGVTRPGVVGLDEQMLGRWFDELEYELYR